MQRQRNQMVMVDHSKMSSDGRVVGFFLLEIQTLFYT